METIIFLMLLKRRQQRNLAEIFLVDDSAIDRRIRTCIVYGFATIVIAAAILESRGLIR